MLEAKKYFDLNVPGFHIYKSVSRVGQHREGVVMLIKSGLADNVVQVDTDTEGQIWVVFSQWATVKLGSVYIPLDDSHYHLAQRQEMSQWATLIHEY